MPEVFLKALNLARNLGRKVNGFTAADMDFIRHYRPRVNVVERPTAERRPRHRSHRPSRTDVPSARRRGPRGAGPRAPPPGALDGCRRDAATAPIALLTDFGYRDHYAGVMRGVIASYRAARPVIDLTHGIPPQSVPRGGDRTARRAGATSRSGPSLWRWSTRASEPRGFRSRSRLARARRFVGPDNGLLWLAANDAGIKRVAELRSPRYRLSEVSSTFHGRDIFAPAAAWLWSGKPLRSLGPTLDKITELSLPMPRRRGDTLTGAVIYIDGFGNLVTNIDRETLERFAASFRHRELLVRIDHGAGMPLVDSYGAARAGVPLAVCGSFELLEVAVRDASAALFFGAREGTPVTVTVAG